MSRSRCVGRKNSVQKVIHGVLFVGRIGMSPPEFIGRASNIVARPSLMRIRPLIRPERGLLILCCGSRSRGSQVRSSNQIWLAIHHYLDRNPENLTRNCLTPLFPLRRSILSATTDSTSYSGRDSKSNRLNFRVDRCRILRGMDYTAQGEQY